MRGIRILSFQPASIYENGGMGRLLRRLYQGKEADVICLYVNQYNSSKNNGLIKEIKINSFPIHRSWMRWKLRPLFRMIRESFFFNYTTRKVESVVLNTSFDVLHVINHGCFSAILCNDKFLTSKKLWTSFHDHYSLCSSFNDTQKLWNLSDRRLMISKELAEEYQRIFGYKSFELITDCKCP